MKNVYNLPLKLLETLFEAFKEVKLTLKLAIQIIFKENSLLQNRKD